jgi:hypothetical protein
MKKSLFFLIILLFFSASKACAGIYLYWPQDKYVTYESVVMLRGVGRDLQILKVNEREITFSPNGSFSCGLVLSPGKNYVEVRALDKNKNHFVNKIRILYLKTYPDIEELYNGTKHWARKQVIDLSTLGLIEGYPDGNFYPGRPITRGELATWIARVKKLKIPTLTKDPFFDVPKEHWRAPFIKAVVDAGLMISYDKNTFGIDDPLSRRNAARIAVAVEDGHAEKARQIFIDVPHLEKSSPIYIAKEEGLVKGVREDLPIFEPDRALTRAEAAVLFSRFARTVNSINNLYDFDKGYTKEDYCRINVAPEIISFLVEPMNVKVDGKTVVSLRVKIAPRTGFFPISKVKVDLTEIGGLPDIEMFDDGTHGDVIKGDSVYSLNVSIGHEESGRKFLNVTVIDRLGWESQKRTSLLILE